MNNPFLRWAGGKRWLVNSSIDFIPEKYERYIEPFIGGGAVFFNESPDNFIIADANDDLINCYQCLSEEPLKFEHTLKQHQRNHSDEYYYKIRASNPRKRHTRAARFVYLNRACFNGLYRVNSKGRFNVPIGTSNNIILSNDDFSNISLCLQNGEILTRDFELTINEAKHNDFVFVDPPYTVKHNMNGFVQYNEKIFSWEDQVRLKNAVVDAVARGAKVTITNADHPSIHALYDGIAEIESVSRNSLIAGQNSNRGKTTEVIIRMGWQKRASETKDISEGVICGIH